MTTAKWSTFVAEWSGLLLWLASQRARDHDEKMDLYARALARVRGALHAKHGTAGMQSWLRVVVSNCHAEMMREKYGRFRYPACLRDADTTTMDLYRLVHRDGFDYHDAGSLLGLGRAEMAGIAEWTERALGRNTETMRGIVSRRARNPLPPAGWACAGSPKNCEELLT